MAQDTKNQSVEYKNQKVKLKKIPKKGDNVLVYTKPGDEVDLSLKGVNPDDLSYHLIGGRYWSLFSLERAHMTLLCQVGS